MAAANSPRSIRRRWWPSPARVARLKQENQTLRPRAVSIPSASRLPTPRALSIRFAFDRDGMIPVFEGSGLLITGRTPQEVRDRSFCAVYAAGPQVVASARRALAGDACRTEVPLGQGICELYSTLVYDPAGGIGERLGCPSMSPSTSRAGRPGPIRCCTIPLTRPPSRAAHRRAAQGGRGTRSEPPAGRRRRAYTAVSRWSRLPTRQDHR